MVPGVTLLCNNLGKFDGLFILKGRFNGGLDKIRQYVLLKYNGKYTITIIPRIRNRMIYQIQIQLSYKKKVKNKIKLVHMTIFNIMDSYLILPASLNQLAESFLGQQKRAFDHSIVTPHWLQCSDHMKLSRLYLYTDLTLLFRVIQSAQLCFHDHFNIDILTRLTLPKL